MPYLANRLGKFCRAHSHNPRAKTNLLKLIEQSERGEEVLIARGKQVVARIAPVGGRPKKRKLNILRGKFKATRNFFEPLPESELESWSH